MERVIIDGSYGEGGGQIIRTALTLSALTGKQLEIDRIRAGRSKPGLQPQHLAAVRVAAMLCDAEVSGAEVGAQSLTFTPRHPVRPGEYRYAIGTAGATTLVAHTALLPLATEAGEATLTIEGGTHVPFAPSAEHLENVYLPALARFGVTAHCSITRAGYYPRGGGAISLRTEPVHEMTGVQLIDRGKLESLTAYIVTSGLPEHVGTRGVAAVREALRDFSVSFVRRDLPSNGPGAAVVVVARCANGFGGFTALGERGKPMERVAEEACQAFRSWWTSGAAVDPNLADQLVLPAALAGKHSRWTTPVVTEHLRTVAWLVGQFLPIIVEFQHLSNGLWQVEVGQ